MNPERAAKGHSRPFVVAVDAKDLIQWIEKDFGLDRKLRRRGVVEIEL